MDLDTIIDQICDLLLQDIILPWYKDISYEQRTFTDTFKYNVLVVFLLIIGFFYSEKKFISWYQI
jgi:hypothetical protein